MKARKKLNIAYLGGSLLLAGAVGWATSSWTMFGISLAALVAFNVLRGNIRRDRGR